MLKFAGLTRDYKMLRLLQFNMQGDSSSCSINKEGASWN
nr:MAG TPA_asm: hypothetical protein [Caudoviricetes sp.]